MVALPAVDPAVTVPSVPILAIVVLLLDHAPPPVASFSKLVAVSHASNVPPMPVGDTFTVTIAVTLHPVADV